MKNYTQILALLFTPVILSNTASGEKIHNQIKKRTITMRLNKPNNKIHKENLSRSLLKKHPAAILLTVTIGLGLAYFVYTFLQTNTQFKKKLKLEKEEVKEEVKEVKEEVEEVKEEVKEVKEKVKEEVNQSPWFTSDKKNFDHIYKLIKGFSEKTNNFLEECNNTNFLNQALEKVDHENNTILHYAACHRNIDFFETLISKIKNKNDKTKHLEKINIKGLTPLHYIAALYHEDLKTTLESLFKKDEDVKTALPIKDAKGRTVLQYYLTFANKEDSEKKLEKKDEEEIKKEIEELKEETF